MNEAKDKDEIFQKIVKMLCEMDRKGLEKIETYVTAFNAGAECERSKKEEE